MDEKTQKVMVMNLFKEGYSAQGVHNRFDMPMDLLSKWEEEYEIRRHIKSLIIEGYFDEAKKEVERLEGDENETVRCSILTKIASLDGDVEEKKRLLDRHLELEPNNTTVMTYRMDIAKKEGDFKTFKELLYRKLSVQPHNTRIRSALIGMATNAKDFEERERLLYEQLEYESDNVETLLNVLRCANHHNHKDIDELIKLGEKILAIDPENQEAKYILERNSIDLNNVAGNKRTRGFIWRQSMKAKEMLEAQAVTSSEAVSCAPEIPKVSGLQVAPTSPTAPGDDGER